MIVRTLSAVLGYGSSLSLLVGAFDYTGGSLRSIVKDISLDEISRKEMIRSTRQRPIEDIFNHTGETPSKEFNALAMHISLTLGS